MPELPEVETVRRGLIPALEGHRLQRVLVLRADLRKPFPANFARRLEGRTVLSIGRRAKYLILTLDDGWNWLVHLGMSGRMLIAAADHRPPGLHDHVIVETEAGQRVTYHDPRRFGLMDLVATTALDAHPLLAYLGPEPLGEGFTARQLAKALAERSSPIKTVLLDQTVIAGLGNIYVSESLFRAGIDPTRPASSVRGKDASRLKAAITSVLKEAIDAGGSSLRDHRRPDGELGYFQHSFAVYDREGKPCPGCTCREGVRRLVQAGRSTFYCPTRQR